MTECDMGRRRDFPASSLLSSGLFLRKLELAAPASAAGCRILFFSDTHFRKREIHNYGTRSPLKKWSGIHPVGEALVQAVQEQKPDVLIFGGDIVSRTCYLEEAFAFLRQMHAPLKLAVYGNWETRRIKKWQSADAIRQGFENAGFRLLCNQSYLWNGIQFFGTDDFRFGRREGIQPDFQARFRCLITHNPDMLDVLPDKIRSVFQLALCGHTHGGQIRLPYFGAFYTSTRHWKKYEYGLYSKPGGPLTAVSAGIGYSWKPIRFRCPPELIQIDLNHGTPENRSH